MLLCWSSAFSWYVIPCLDKEFDIFFSAIFMSSFFFYSNLLNMVKANYNTRDMRALQRELRKTKCELVQTKKNAAAFSKMVYRARDKALVSFLRTHKQKKTLGQENRILLQSLNNFNAVCNKQQMTIRKQAASIKMLQKSSKELHLLKRSLKSIRHKRNPRLIRVADI